MSEDRRTLMGTGIMGLDAILRGGLPSGRIYLVEGAPGVGKTTLGLQFLLEGIRCRERAMMVSLIETEEELVEVARSHGWDTGGLHILEIPQTLKAASAAVQTVFPPGEVEFGEIAGTIVDAVEQYRPQRLLIDSISQLGMLTDNQPQMRSSVLKIRDLVSQIGATTLFTSSRADRQVAELDTIVHGTISLRTHNYPFGPISRELSIKKMRGHQFVTGRHNYRILTGGLELFTWRLAPQRAPLTEWQVLSSGNRHLDDLLGGGLEEGTACLINGTTGAGKSTMASLYVQAAARRGEASVIFCFDERKETFLRRSASLNLDIPAYIEQGLIDLHQVNTGQVSPGEFTQNVISAVEKKDAKVVVIDSLTGYMNTIPGDEQLMRQMHELLSYLSGIGVLTIMVVTKFGTSGIAEMQIDASYLADTVIVMRHFEALGTLRRCIAVLKKRHGRHEHTIREFKISDGGCEVGPPLTAFNGILTGNPTYFGDREKLMDYGNKE
ncbi:MAG: ATPase domain-containing protein [Desulfosarcina sp.]